MSQASLSSGSHSDGSDCHNNVDVRLPSTPPTPPIASSPSPPQWTPTRQGSWTRPPKLRKHIAPGYIVELPALEDVDTSSRIHAHPDFQKRADPTEPCGFGHPALILCVEGGIATCLSITSFGNSQRDIKYHRGEGARARAKRYLEIGKKFDEGGRSVKLKDWDGEHIPILKLERTSTMRVNPSYVNIARTFEIEVQHLREYCNSNHHLDTGEFERLASYRETLTNQGLVEESDRISTAPKEMRPKNTPSNSPPTPSLRRRHTQERPYQSCGQQYNRADEIWNMPKWR